MSRYGPRLSVVGDAGGGAVAPRSGITRCIRGIALTGNGAEVTARVHEDNDFSLLIGFPGWDATSTFTLDANRQWVAVLRAWRAATGQADPTSR